MFTEIIFVCLIFLVAYFVVNDKKPEGMPPGIWGWPIIGKIPAIRSGLYQHIEKYKQTYGKIFTWRMGSYVYVYLCDYKLVKEAFSNPYITNRSDMFAFAIFADLQKIGIINNEGTPWSNIRRFTLRYLKDNGMGKESLEDVVRYEAECLVEDFKKHTNITTEIPWSVNVAVVNVLWKIVADKHYEMENKEIQDLEKLMANVFNIAQSPNFLVFSFIPAINSFIPDVIKRKFIFKEFNYKFGMFRDFFRNSIKEHKEAFNKYDIKDYIDAFLNQIALNKEGKVSQQTSTFTEKELLYGLSDLFAAGTETTSSTIRWILHYLTKYENVQQKVQNEIDSVLPRSRLPTLSDKEKLPYLNAVIYEVLRMDSVAPLGFFHCASHDTTIGNYRIPKGTAVVSDIAGCHMDPDYWDKPKEFIPERFILPDGSLNNSKESFIPFSIGRRACLGESLAKLELYLFVGALCQNFSFKPVYGDEMNFERDSTNKFLSIPEPMNVIISERIENTNY